MSTIAERISQNVPRFKKQEGEVIYRLFDAFLKTTLLDDRIIDFSQEPVKTPDGIIEFFSREESFKDMVKGVVDGTATAEANALFNAHVFWLWTLGMSGTQTTCGTDNLKVLKLEEKGIAFPGKLGLWNAPATISNKRNDFALISAILSQFVTWSKKPEFANLDELKAAFLKFVLKTRRTVSAGIRHGLMHLCDPALYIPLYTVEEKVAVIKQHSKFIENFEQTPVKYRFTSYFEDTHKGYYAEFSDEQVAHIFDALAALPAESGLEYDAFMKQFFEVKLAKKTPSKPKKT